MEMHPLIAMQPRSTSNWDRFCLLFWKNLVTTRRNYRQSIPEIAFPVLICSLLVVLRKLIDPEVYSEPFDYQPLSIVNTTWNETRNFTWSIAYSPQNVILDEIMKEVQTDMNLSRIDPFASEKLLNEHLTIESNRPLVGIIFDESFSPSTSTIPKNLTYKLRFPGELRNVPQSSSDPTAQLNNWMTQFLYPQLAEGGPRNKFSSTGGPPPAYYDEKFSSVQSAVSLAFIKRHMKEGATEEALPEITLQRFSYPPATVDSFLPVMKMLITILLVLSFVFPSTNLVKSITVEKESQLKETMKIMGLPSWLNWTAWFTRAMISMIISMSLIIIILKLTSTPPVLPHSNSLALWFLFFVYSISNAMFIFLISVLFSNASTASACTAFFCVISMFPYTITERHYETLSLATKMLTCLFHNSGFSYGIRLILGHEANLEGLQWSNYFSPVTVDDNFTVGHVTIMLLIASFLYLMITLYLEKIFPGDYGVPEKWNFPLKMLYELVTNRKMNVENVVHHKNGIEEASEFMEPYPVGKNAGIQMKGLRKVFGNKKVAVTGLNLNMYDDEITILLGDNGAGKTTTMSMLTGMFPPTSGTAIVNGSDIRTDIEGVRQSIGLCPQHNILFDDLTVREHIIFFSKLKGLNHAEAELEVEKYVEMLDLQPKIDALSKTLSGGMKRKLSIGVALCGGSKVVLCDEPTSGMDPAARRTLWDLLQHEKKGRTIVLSTHFMDEADVLGDRIAIMHSGELKCYGSSFYLKNIFGAGYELICEKGPECDVNGVTKLMRRYIPDIKVDTDVGSELSYKLDSQNSNLFKGMLRELEDNLGSLGVEGYGISLTTLEEVFIKVTSDKPRNSKERDLFEEDLESPALSFQVHNATITGATLWKNQSKAMFLKRWINTKRNWGILLGQLLIPVWLIVVTMLMMKTTVVKDALPPLTIEMDIYELAKPVAILSDHTKNKNSIGEHFATRYSQLFANPTTPRTLVTIPDIRDYIMNLTGAELVTFNCRYLIGVTVEDDKITTWFNNQPYHTVPLSLQVTFNALLREYCADCSMTVVNEPLPFTFDTRLAMLKAGNNLGFVLVSQVGLSMCFVAAFYILFYIRERVSKAKLLQFVSGVNIFIFWSTAFLWDLVTFLLTVIVAMVTVLVFQEDGWKTSEDMGRLFIVLSCFAWCVLPFVYVYSRLFDSPSNGFVKTMTFAIWGVIMHQVISVIDSMRSDHIGENMSWGLLVLPHFALVHGLANLNKMSSIIQNCQQACEAIGPMCPNVDYVCNLVEQCCETNYFAWKSPGIGRDITYMLVAGIILFVVLFLRETGIFIQLWYKVQFMFGASKLPHLKEDEMDSDVLAEKRLIDLMPMTKIQATNLVARSMSKFYKKYLAVNQLSLAVHSRECFGLLGVNGAGKTTTFKMLIGDEFISSGDAWISGISLKTNLKEIYKDIGYCPQFDALFDDLTGRETLTIFCLIRGIPTHKIKTLSLKLAKELNFIRHIDKEVKEYSGGNKRKLSTALALIGSPTVVYLDEPTTGMDPGAKRHLWGVMSKYRNAGKSIVLTSHSMEECEALCTRLAIMVNGEFKCLGSTQHLKNKFSKGFLLIIQMSNRNSSANAESRKVVEKVKNYIVDKLPGSGIREEHQGRLVYFIPKTNTRWSAVFDILETAKKVLPMESYSLSQNSLEQVFLDLVQEENKRKGGV